MKQFLFFMLVTCYSFGQESSTSTTSSKPKWYTMTATEFIFSRGDVKANINGENISLDPIVRFSGFFHLQSQLHVDYTPHFGIYTGLGVRNVGFINTFDLDGKEVELKQRSYSLGVPLALKFGNMANGVYLALGAEAELMFAYKRKVFYEGNKSKSYGWFSKEVNLFNPSVFADIRFKRGFYVRFKYYLLDFLADRTTSFYLPESPVKIDYHPTESKLFYVSFGGVIKDPKRRKHRAKKSEV